MGADVWVDKMRTGIHQYMSMLGVNKGRNKFSVRVWETTGG
jgi:hypothetical protein